jgi:hypothetical protein
MGEGGRPIFCDVLVEHDATLSIAQESRQRSLPFQERKLTQILAIVLDKVEGAEDRSSSGLTTGQLLEP